MRQGGGARRGDMETPLRNGSNKPWQQHQHQQYQPYEMTSAKCKIAAAHSAQMGECSRRDAAEEGRKANASCVSRRVRLRCVCHRCQTQPSLPSGPREQEAPLETTRTSISTRVLSSGVSHLLRTGAPTGCGGRHDSETISGFPMAET